MLTIIGLIFIIIGISIIVESLKTNSSMILFGVFIMVIGSGMLSAVASI